MPKSHIWNSCNIEKKKERISGTTNGLRHSQKGTGLGNCFTLLVSHKIFYILLLKRLSWLHTALKFIYSFSAVLQHPPILAFYSNTILIVSVHGLDAMNLSMPLSSSVSTLFREDIFKWMISRWYANKSYLSFLMICK